MAQRLAVHYFASVIGSTLLWILPAPLKADRAITTFSLLASVAGYGYAFVIAKPLDKIWKLERQEELKEERVQAYGMAVAEKTEKQELAQLYAPLTQAVSGISEKISEKISEMSGDDRLPGGSGISEKISENSETKTWTSFNLTQSEAIQMITQSKAQGMKKTEIIQFLWEVKPGNNKAYKEALAQYDRLNSLEPQPIA